MSEPWTYEMLDYGGERFILRLGPLTGGDTDFGEGYHEGYQVIFGTEKEARLVCDAVALRTALARAIEGGYAADCIDLLLYFHDPVYHAVVQEVRHHRFALSRTDSNADLDEHDQFGLKHRSEQSGEGSTPSFGTTPRGES